MSQLRGQAFPMRVDRRILSDQFALRSGKATEGRLLKCFQAMILVLFTTMEQALSATDTELVATPKSSWHPSGKPFLGIVARAEDGIQGAILDPCFLWEHQHEGLRRGDLLVAFNGVKITSPEKLRGYLDACYPYDTVEIDVLRESGQVISQRFPLISRQMGSELVMKKRRVRRAAHQRGLVELVLGGFLCATGAPSIHIGGFGDRGKFNIGVPPLMIVGIGFGALGIASLGSHGDVIPKPEEWM